jgi:CRP-like cAMP-binding protein
VELIDSNDTHSRQIIGKNEAVGWLDFLTGSPFCCRARSLEDTTLWVLPHTAFVGLVRNSPTLLQRVHRELLSAPVAVFLHQQHGMRVDAVKNWQMEAGRKLMRLGIYPPATEPDQQLEAFVQGAKNFTHLELFSDLPENELHSIASRLISHHFTAGESLIHQGEEADRLYIVQQGDLRLIDAQAGSGVTIRYADGDVFGFRAFLSGSPHTLTAVVTANSRLWALRRSDFDELLRTLPELKRRVQAFLQSKEMADYLHLRHHHNPDNIERWVRKAVECLKTGQPIPPASSGFDLSKHKGAPLAIWLGLTLDSIPEALVIGASVSHSKLGLSLLVGLLLSNYPEALSSSVGMRQQGMRRLNILMLWTSLMLITGLIAAFGSLFFGDVGVNTYAFTEGVAAGAMLTMIAQTMLPEAYIKGGSVVGFSTLLGFLTAVSFKTVG